MADAGKHHVIDYVEIYVTDMDRAKAFYGEVFGWKLTEYAPSYVGFSDGARGVREAGGLCLVENVTPGGPLVLLYSADLEQSQKAVQSGGGKLRKRIYPFPGGRRFEFEDPSGNVLGVWGE
ncbi:MAG: VOC family protein [Myxococcales bacterium]|nr:VOC family protein [Myxococcales bacterium]